MENMQGLSRSDTVESASPTLIGTGVTFPDPIARVPVAEPAPETDELWRQAFETALRKLPAKDSEWLADTRNQRAFTSTQLIEAIRPLQDKHTNLPVQRFLSRIDPIVSHIRSFAGVISVFANADPVGAGCVWGSIYLVLVVASRTQRTLERILDLLSELSPQLALFARWHRIFPHKSFVEVGDAIKDAYCATIAFCATAVRHLRRNPLKNMLHVVFNPKMERDLHLHELALQRSTARVKLEVDTAHMQFVQTQLAAIGTVINASPTPLYMELPSIRLIPHSRNNRFFGRHKILSQMGDTLSPLRKGLRRLSGHSDSDRMNQKRFALTGLGGSGKTQIALEYTYRHLDDYKVVIWILADSLEKITQGFEETAEVLGMPKGTQSANQVRTFVLQRLSATNDPYLLCFDNADDLSLIKNCFPRDNKGTILLTSRDSIGTGTVANEGVVVPEFTIQEGCEFLSSLLQTSDGFDIVHNDLDSNERHTLEKISTTFHGYPLALTQAAAFIRNGGCALADFLDIFRDKKHSNAIASIPVEDYHATLFTVWDLSFNSLSEQSRQILEMLVYFDPDSVPYELFEKGCISPNRTGTAAAGSAEPPCDDPDNKSIKSAVSMRNLSFMANPVDLWAAVKGLRHQSLIRTNQELRTISIHRFLQEQAFTRLCFEPSLRRKAFEESLFILSNHQPEFPNVTQHWSPDLFRASELSLPHIKTLAARFWESPDVFVGLENKLGKLIFECASYQFERFHHQASTETFALARRVIQLSPSPNELTLADCYRMEGRMFNESGQAERGAVSNKLAQEYTLAAISKGYIGPEDQRMPRILTGLGNSLSQLHHFDEALAAQLEAKKLCGDVPPERSDAITIIQLNLGFLLYRRGEFHNAEQILRATLEANPRTPPALYALGNTLLAQGKVEESIAVHLKGLEIYIEMFGDEHALVGRGAYKVGEILLLHKKDPKTARTYIRKAIKIYLNQESPYYTVKAYARAARMMAKAFQMEGRTDDAKGYFEEAWSLREQIDGVKGSPKDKDMDYTRVMFYWDQ